MDTPDLDTLLRLAAFERVRGLNETHDYLTAEELKPGILSRGASASTRPYSLSCP